MSYAGKTEVDPYAGSPNVARCEAKSKEKKRKKEKSAKAPTRSRNIFYQLNNACALRRRKYVNLVWCHGYDAHDHGLIFFQPIGIYSAGRIKFIAPFAHQGLTPMHLEAYHRLWVLVVVRHTLYNARELHNCSFAVNLARARWSNEEG